jgi:hypothetical protein
VSGFDTSQPVADEKSLKDANIEAESEADGKSAVSDDAARPTEPDELGDATPGPR